MDDLKEELAKQSGGVLTEAYKDLIRPSAEPVGTMLSMLPRTIRLGLSKWEKWIINGEESLKLTAEALQEKVKRIPEEKQCEPEPYIVVPAIQQISYCYDSKELREMYANLLATSMNLDTKWKVHPAYVDLIRQLTPDEAKLIRALQSQPDFPVIHVKQYMKDQKTYNDIAINYSDLGEKFCEIPDGIYSYLNNLCRLGIIDIDYGIYCTYKGAYTELDLKFRTTREEWEKSGGTIKILHGLMELTHLGRDFAEICLGAQ